MRRFLVAAAVLAAATPAAATRTYEGFSETEDFEGLASGAASLDFGNATPDDGILSGGTVTAGTLALPAHSGSQVYGGTTITFDVSDKVDYTWPAFAAWVVGPARIFLSVYTYDPNTMVESYHEAAVTDSPTVPGLLRIGYGRNDAPGQYTRAVFSSDQPFVIDDFTLGLVDVPPGIPEPASWASMIAGFGLAGAATRRRTRFA